MLNRYVRMYFFSSVILCSSLADPRFFACEPGEVAGRVRHVLDNAILNDRRDQSMR